jgi:hypothetical protein
MQKRKPMSKFKLSQNKSKQLEDAALMRGLEVLGPTDVQSSNLGYCTPTDVQFAQVGLTLVDGQKERQHDNL